MPALITGQLSTCPLYSFPFHVHKDFDHEVISLLHHPFMPFNVIILIKKVSSIFLTPCYMLNCVPSDHWKDRLES